MFHVQYDMEKWNIKIFSIMTLYYYCSLITGMKMMTEYGDPQRSQILLTKDRGRLRWFGALLVINSNEMHCKYLSTEVTLGVLHRKFYLAAENQEPKLQRKMEDSMDWQSRYSSLCSVEERGILFKIFHIHSLIIELLLCL